MINWMLAGQTKFRGKVKKSSLKWNLKQVDIIKTRIKYQASSINYQ